MRSSRENAWSQVREVRQKQNIIGSIGMESQQKKGNMLQRARSRWNSCPRSLRRGDFQTLEARSQMLRTWERAEGRRAVWETTGTLARGRFGQRGRGRAEAMLQGWPSPGPPLPGNPSTAFSLGQPPAYCELSLLEHKEPAAVTWI